MPVLSMGALWHFLCLILDDMELDYFTLLSSKPIKLSIGTIRQPTPNIINEEISFSTFCTYQSFLLITPGEYYKSVDRDHYEEWNALSVEDKTKFRMYEVTLLDKRVREIYLSMFNFFFIQRVIFRDNVYVLLNTDDYDTPDDEVEINEENLSGVITGKTFSEALDILKQVCCIKSNNVLDEPEPRFRNEKARLIWLKLQEAKKLEMARKNEKEKKDFELANIISSVAAKSPNLNIIEIQNATLFQIYDQFRKLGYCDSHHISSTRVAVWGDEKNTFDPTLWYRNTFKEK